MSRKNKAQADQPLVQYKHLRFADADTGKIQPNGGYTLAYRCTQSPGDVPGAVRVEVSYAFSECNISDNFNKRQGRGAARARLLNKAEEYFEAFDITDRLPEGYMDDVINLGNGLIDIHSKTFDIVRAVVEQFLNTFGAVLYIGNPEYVEGSLFENLMTLGERETLVINSAVLNFEEPGVEDIIYQANATIADTAVQLLDMMENFNLEDPPSANMTTLEEIRSGIKSIRDLAQGVLDASDEESEEESEEEEEGDDEEIEGSDEADDLDTEEDDGGLDDEENEDEESEDDIEGSEDEEGDDEEGSDRQ